MSQKTPENLNDLSESEKRIIKQVRKGGSGDTNKNEDLDDQKNSQKYISPPFLRKIFNIVFPINLLFALLGLVALWLNDIVWASKHYPGFYVAREWDNFKVTTYDKFKYKIAEYPDLWSSMLNVLDSLFIFSAILVALLLLLEKKYKKYSYPLLAIYLLFILNYFTTFPFIGFIPYASALISIFLFPVIYFIFTRKYNMRLRTKLYKVSILSYLIPPFIGLALIIILIILGLILSV
ncbi:MAG: hypothetical protein ABEJ24_01225 [Candidatus Magasanikbacteria bacterium]